MRGSSAYGMWYCTNEHAKKEDDWFRPMQEVFGITMTSIVMASNSEMWVYHGSLQLQVEKKATEIEGS